jgi:hypothetical protein
MSGQSKRAIRPSAAIIVASLVISASVLFALSPYGPGGARTTIKTVTTTLATSLVTTTAASTAPVSSIQLHKVTFNESTGCDNSYADRWAVTLENITISQPSSATLPFSGAQGFSEAGKMISKIIFTVPDGIYNYNVSASALTHPFSGTVNVKGSDVVVQLEAEPLCIRA